MRALFRAFSSARAFERAQRAARLGSRPLVRRGRIERLPWPLSGWSSTRDLPEPPNETFRAWWRREHGGPKPVPQPHVERLPRISRSAVPPRHDWRFGRVADPADRKPGDARAAILDRIRSALADRPAPPEVPRGYRTRDRRSREEIVALFAERAGEYRATVRRAAANELRRTLSQLCREQGVRRLAVPEDLADAWRPDGVELVPDTGLSPHELDTLDGALTGCALAIAETGTFVLDGGPAQGRRALTLVPDLHVCVVREDQVVGLVPEAVAQLERAVRAGRALTFVSGPSATSDIELDRVEGVHGPRRLHLVVAAP